MLLVHQAGSVKVGEVVRYVIDQHLVRVDALSSDASLDSP